MCIENPLTLFLSFGAYINTHLSIVCVDVHCVVVYTHLLPQP